MEKSAYAEPSVEPGSRQFIAEMKERLQMHGKRAERLEAEAKDERLMEAACRSALDKLTGGQEIRL
jgi:hypothetical protein